MTFGSCSDELVPVVVLEVWVSDGRVRSAAHETSPHCPRVVRGLDCMRATRGIGSTQTTCGCHYTSTALVHDTLVILALLLHSLIE